MTSDRRSRIHGLLLGAPVEFLSLNEIRRRYGPDGIRDLDTAYGRIGAITDDTQMTLFTAEAVLRIASVESPSVEPVVIAWNAYRRWLRTQEPRTTLADDDDTSWLLDVRALHDRRAPGNTCLSALRRDTPGTVSRPLNDSKGCGGVMRVAPVAVLPYDEPFDAGAELAAITHGHPSGYLASGALVHLLYAVLDGASIGDAVRARSSASSSRAVMRRRLRPFVRRSPPQGRVRRARSDSSGSARGGWRRRRSR